MLIFEQLKPRMYICVTCIVKVLCHLYVIYFYVVTKELYSLLKLNISISDEAGSIGKGYRDQLSANFRRSLDRESLVTAR